MPMNPSENLKMLGLALPFAGIVWKWLRRHHDRFVGPPPKVADKQGIVHEVRAGR